MSTTFQTVVKKDVSSTRRFEAIETLVRTNETANLALLVRMDGLGGEFRRRALDGLADCHATAALEELADDKTIDPSLRRTAERLA